MPSRIRGRLQSTLAAGSKKGGPKEFAGFSAGPPGILPVQNAVIEILGSDEFGRLAYAKP
jgi:hypothetical protein